MLNMPPSFVRGDLCFDLSHYLPELKVSTVILWGKQAQFTSLEVGKRLAALNPDAIKRFEEIEDVGLTPQLELPAITIGLIRISLALLEKKNDADSEIPAKLED